MASPAFAHHPARKYSYFDGCSQGGHQALTEAQRFPKDFNGILAGAPATIVTELNSILHEYEFDSVLNSSGQSVLDEPQAQAVLNAALKTCDAKVGLMLDYRACEQKFKLESVKCSVTKTTNCLTGARRRAQDPGGAGGSAGVASEPFTKAYFDKVERLAPFWDDTNPYLQPFANSGGKLIRWQGTGDWSIPTGSSLAYYQAVVKASGGLTQAKQFSRCYQLPSVGHCGGGAPDTYAGVRSVARWVETGHAPGALVARQYQTPPMTGGPPTGTQPTTDLTDAVPTL